jgi:hypothetical protein
MWIDKRATFCTAQALTVGTTPLTDFYNAGGDFDLGPGNQCFWVIQVDVAANQTGGNTYTFTIETDTTNAFGAAVTIATIVVPLTAVVGNRFILGFPWANLKYFRGKAVLVGASSAISVSSWVTKELPSAYQAYPQKINV